MHVIYKKLLITQVTEVAQLLNEYINAHNKMYRSAGTFESLFKSIDFTSLCNESFEVMSSFERKSDELKRIKEKLYGNFAKTSKEFFEALDSYFNALFDTVKQLHLLMFRLCETSKGIVNNKRRLSWTEYSQLTKEYDEKVKRYIDLGDKLNRAYRAFENGIEDITDCRVNEKIQTWI